MLAVWLVRRRLTHRALVLTGLFGWFVLARRCEELGRPWGWPVEMALRAMKKVERTLRMQCGWQLTQRDALDARLPLRRMRAAIT